MSLFDTSDQVQKSLDDMRDYYQQRVLELACDLAQSQVKIQKLRQFLLEAPARTGVCCCGEDMDNHSDPMSSGHTPRDEWDWAVECILREIGEYEKHDTSF